jgi:hypothetical protein
MEGEYVTVREDPRVNLFSVNNHEITAAYTYSVYCPFDNVHDNTCNPCSDKKAEAANIELREEKQKSPINWQ